MTESEWIAFFQNDRFAVEAGIVLERVLPGDAVASMVVDKRHLNAGGVCQGGAIFTLADLAMAAAVNAHGRLSFSLQSDIRFLVSAQLGDALCATVEEVVVGQKVAHYRVQVHNQEAVLIAVVDGICYRK